MSERPALPLLVPGLALAVAIALAGWFVGNGLYRARVSERYVTVKGFAEREVAADLVLWPIVFTVTAADLETLQRKVDDGTGRVCRYPVCQRVGKDHPSFGVCIHHLHRLAVVHLYDVARAVRSCGRHVLDGRHHCHDVDWHFERARGAHGSNDDTPAGLVVLHFVHLFPWLY